MYVCMYLSANSPTTFTPNKFTVHCLIKSIKASFYCTEMTVCEQYTK